MKKEEFDISGLYGKTGGAKWDLRTHTENGFTVILHSPQVTFPDHGVGTERTPVTIDR